MFLIAALPGALVLGCWHARNWSVADYGGFSTQLNHVNRSADYAVWRADHPGASPEERWRERERRGLMPEAMSSVEPLRLGSSLASRLRIHLLGVLRVVANPGAMAWGQLLGFEPPGGGPQRELHRGGPLSFFLRRVTDRPHFAAGAVVLGALTLAYWALFALGLRELASRNRLVALALALVISYFVLASGGPWGESRFRVPFASLLCVIAGAGIDRVTRSPARGERVAAASASSGID